MRVAIVGAGNVATSLAHALKKAEVNFVAVWSRSMASVCMLAESVDVPGYTEIQEMPDADIVIISVADDALPDIASKVAVRYKNSLVLHTAGSMSMNILADAGCISYGVLYPMQTFSKARVVDFSSVCMFVEGSTDVVATEIERLALRLTDKVCSADSKQRSFLHLAAVFACNFSNAVYSMAAEILNSHNLPFDAMLPLIDETVAKVHTMRPVEAQTGPARRGDTIVMAKHSEMLDGELKEIYNVLSKYIQNSR